MNWSIVHVPMKLKKRRERETDDDSEKRQTEDERHNSWISQGGIRIRIRTTETNRRELRREQQRSTRQLQLSIGRRGSCHLLWLLLLLHFIWSLGSKKRCTKASQLATHISHIAKISASSDMRMWWECYVRILRSWSCAIPFLLVKFGSVSVFDFTSRILPYNSHCSYS